ncbi:hypothetical protein CHLNCDRAFT_134781 [Chlorella variabilis]|uniref:HIT-type domain-containing protein n=1 Tax=Chlorella variabilis TaxID=554065 RepID=E1ZGR8_CHLVA|nr:hypothetical protein CHLNCDRAFT_134781 [Chlorella variabilis]EFN54985.1 hypothetical protein CHLNCDRAFT_134781 [Chlorella variabilis]|eukprot:XP_005847087.1 hypothetical protein CHLNCDRAFT_134781 [Chlorella variabilis]
MAAPLCRVCRQHTAGYTCPRCNARYCSLDCYRQHSDRCTEGFYRDSAVSELRSISAGEDERQRMLEILQRMHQQELGGGGSGASSGDEGGEESEEEGGLSAQTLHRLLAKMEAAGGVLDVGADDLSPAELAAFHRALAAGELSGTVQPWQPWWLSEAAAGLELGARGTPLMTAVGEGETGQQGGDGGAPQQRQAGGSSAAGAAPLAAAAAPGAAGGGGGLPEPPSRALPPLAALTKAAPSPLLQYQLLDLLYAYCLTLRLYNGDYQCEAEAAAGLLFGMSAVLAAVAPSPGGGGGEGDAAAVPSVLLGCLQRACQPPAGSQDSRGFAIGVLSDVAAVLQLGRAVVLTAVMDLSRVLEAARQQLEGAAPDASGSGGSPSKQQRKELRRRLVAAERKLLFFLAWANEQPPEVYDLLALAVAAEHRQHAAAAAAAGGSPDIQVTGSQPGAGSSKGDGASSGGGAPAAPRAVLIEEL